MILSSRTFGIDEASGNIVVDLYISAIGYETRSTALICAGRVATRRHLAIMFAGDQVLAFQDNLAVMRRLGARLVDDVVSFCRRDLCNELVAIARETGSRPRLAIDVSSMNRTMAATILTVLFANRQLIESLEICYVPARYVAPALSFTPITQVGAVTPELSGFDAEPGLPIALVLGLGYEYGTAIGLIHQLEPQYTLCLRAIGRDQRFQEAVRSANLDFDFGAYNVELTEYDLNNVQSAFQHIENIVFSLQTNFRVVLVPMGPKILASLLVLVAIKYFGKVAVWRVARESVPSDVHPDGQFVRASIDIRDESMDGATIRLGQLMRTG